MKIELNIGLISQDLTTNLDWLEVSRLLSYHIDNLRVSETRLKYSSYLEQPEPTLYVDADYTGSFGELVAVIEALCEVLNQECIALVSEVGDMLVFNTNYNVVKNLSLTLGSLLDRSLTDESSIDETREHLAPLS